jgi:S1-C subfamily serine protease
MKLEEASFVNLVALAKADGLVSQSELSLLERYREALGLSEEFAKSTLAKDRLNTIGAKELKGKPGDRLHVLKMMIRVAYADGGISKQEKVLINRVARSFGIGRLAMRGLCWEIERELGIQRKLRISQAVAVAAILVAAVIVWLTYEHFSSSAERRMDETRISLEELREQMGLERTQAEKALRTVRASQEEITENETALLMRIRELEQMTADERDTLNALTAEQRSRQVQMEQEVERLRRELAKVRTLNTIFKDVEKEYGRSVLLIFVTYELVMNQNRIQRSSMGSGFFVSSAGHIVTNKHVVQPWKFSGEDILLMEHGYTLEQNSMIMAAWPASTVVKTAAGLLDIDTAFSTVGNNLALENTAPDTFEIRRIRLDSGAAYEGNFHVPNENDLAVLKAAPAAPVVALPLAGASEKPEKLDPVMVLGFPTGIDILESTRAETSPSLGEVRKIEKNIMVTAPIFPGNSGGPLVDARGKVVGVATGIFGGATLGSCIPTEYVLPLLPSSAELLSQIDRHEAAGMYRAALDDLRLAEQRCTDEKEREVIKEQRARLIGIRDRMIREARSEAERAKKAKGLQDVIDRFGPHWAKEAVEILHE